MLSKFSIDESPDIVVNLTFSTTVLTDGSGAEERNSNWQSPLLNFDLQKVILHRPQLDEIIQFFREARGAAISFKYRDWSDYLVTAQPRTTRYGSTTQGLLLPNADGVRNEFELVKRYIVPSCTHLRAIAFADPDTVTLYDANFNPFPDTDWIFADGKFVFTTPPPAGQLFCEGEFDVPVVFASDENQYRIKSTKAGNTYSIEGLQLNEVRGSSFLTSDLTPLTSLKDDLGEIDAVFALSGHFNSLVGLREQTEIITLASGFDKRTSRFSKPKGTYFLGKIPLHDDELDYLIAFFRCTKGKGLSWAFEDVSYQQKLVAVRFDEDNLSLRLNRQGRYETDGLKAIQVFEPLPAKVSEGLPVDPQNGGGNGSGSGGGNGSGSGSGSGSGGQPTPPIIVLPGSGGGNSRFQPGLILGIQEIAGKLILFRFSFESGSYTDSYFYLQQEQNAGQVDFSTIYTQTLTYQTTNVHYSGYPIKVGNSIGFTQQTFANFPSTARKRFYAWLYNGSNVQAATPYDHSGSYSSIYIHSSIDVANKNYVPLMAYQGVNFGYDNNLPNNWDSGLGFKAQANNPDVLLIGGFVDGSQYGDNGLPTTRKVQIFKRTSSGFTAIQDVATIPYGNGDNPTAYAYYAADDSSKVVISFGSWLQKSIYYDGLTKKWEINSSQTFGGHFVVYKDGLYFFFQRAAGTTTFTTGVKYFKNGAYGNLADDFPGALPPGAFCTTISEIPGRGLVMAFNNGELRYFRISS